jgi:hypothetical protein
LGKTEGVDLAEFSSGVIGAVVLALVAQPVQRVLEVLSSLLGRTTGDGNRDLILDGNVNKKQSEVDKD